MKRAGLLLLAIQPCVAVGVEAPPSCVHVVYLTTRDRDPLPDYRGRIHRMMADIQDFYRSEMDRNGYGPLTFRLDVAADGLLRVPVVKLDWDFDPHRRWAPRELRPYVQRTLAAEGVDIDRAHFVAFLHAYWKDGDRWRYDVVYSGSGDTRRGAAWVVDHAWLDPRNFNPSRKETINDRGQKLTMAQFNVKMIGGIAHELGHAFGLPHNSQRPDELRWLGNALMGAGNYTYRRERIGRRKGAFLTRAHAFALSLHPLFTGRAAAEAPSFTLRDLRFEQAGSQLLVGGRVTPAEQCAGVVVYHDEWPTGTNKDYDARSYLARWSDEGRFLAAADLAKAGDFALKIRPYSNDGAQHTFTFRHSVQGNVKTDLQSLRRDALWLDVRQSFDIKDASRLAAAADALAEMKDSRVSNARRLLAITRQWQGFPTPAEATDDLKSLRLCEARWESASVGWFMPSFDGVLYPDGQRLDSLASAERPHTHGLYAHAESHYRFRLDGQWRRFLAACGLQARHGGSVIFVVRGDGRELFRSKLLRLRDGETPVDVSVSGVKELELVTLPGDDGKDSDWGVWFEPTLER